MATLSWWLECWPIMLPYAINYCIIVNGAHKHHGPTLKAARKGHNSSTEEIVVFALNDCAGVVLANSALWGELPCLYGDS